ncbi:multicopper oxidase family protein [Peterkaempfera sp. SMS 1(5)a]|uniref:multicopper oxidase family protein n=1 Tax=Peterkaempfera podocarpi TaxID=3232308 RepID=UPI0036709140
MPSSCRRPLRLTASLAAAALALAAAGCAPGTTAPPAEPAALAVGPASPAGAASAAGGRTWLSDPPQLVSRNGVLRARIVVERRKVRLAGRQLWALTYNGLYMPPTLRIRPGDRMELAMENRVGPGTNVHVHGLHVSPDGRSDNVFVDILPGHTFHYSYRFPGNLTPGTYWYHSHAHPISAEQVAGGLSGIIIVDGLRHYLPPALRHITEHVIALKDFQVQGDAIRTKGLKISSPTTRTVNGQLDPAIRIRPGETQLWRLANIGANIYYKLRLAGHRFQVIAQDGYPVNRVWTAASLVIAAGARFDVLVQGGAPGTTRLETLPYDTGPAGNQFPRATLATVVTGGPPMRPAALPTAFAPFEDLSGARIAARRTIVFSEDTKADRYFINGRQFDMNRVDVHTDQFQVMSTNGRPEHSQGRQDIVNVPARGRVVIRIPFTDFTGRTVLHCHILNHEDLGMMAVLEIVP